MLCVHRELPLYRPEIGRMLGVILGRQNVSLGDSDFMIAFDAAIDARVRRRDARGVYRVECFAR